MNNYDYEYEYYELWITMNMRYILFLDLVVRETEKEG